MAIGACEKNNILALFPDNTTQEIQPADLRQLVNCVYDNFLDLSDIVDNVQTSTINQALSANMGVYLSNKIDQNSQSIYDLDQNKVEKGDVYTKQESDNLYYQQSYIDVNYYDKGEVYNKLEIDQALQSIQQALLDLDARVSALENP